MFKCYRVKLQFSTPFAAGLPKDPKILLGFLKGRAPNKKPEGATAIEQIAEEVEEELYDSGEPEITLTTTFKQDKGVIVYEDRGVKAHIKDCANILRRLKDIRGLKTIVADRVWVEPRFIPLTKSGQPVKEISGSEIKPITVRDRRTGQSRTAVKIVEFVESPAMEFDLKVLDDGLVSQELLEDIFKYGGQIKGMGADRGLGWGRYTFELEEKGEKKQPRKRKRAGRG